MATYYYNPQELSERMHAESIITDGHASIRTLLIDSRRVDDQKHALFFALSGQRNGHDYLDEVYSSGVRSFVVSQTGIKTTKFPNANFYFVPDTLTALQDLAAYHRSRFSYPVVGIAGSNGKTIVKEWLYQLLSPDHRVIRSPKSYNSQIGVPLSVWSMDEDHDLALIEAGISTTSEMMKLERIIKPSIGVLTSIGEAHQGGFASTAEKIAEKLILFKGVELFIYPRKYLQPDLAMGIGKLVFSWGYEEGADLRILDSFQDGSSTIVTTAYQNSEFNFRIPFTDQASLENAMTCLSFMLAFGISIDTCLVRLERLFPVEMRQELKKGINGCSVIDDSYSLDLSSLTIALDFLDQQKQHPRRTVILSDIPGNNSSEIYQTVNEMFVNKSVNRLIGIGKQISAFRTSFTIERQFFESTEEFIEQFDGLQFRDETILLKGSRAFEFERLSKLLVQRVHGTVLEINLNAMQHNLSYFRSRLGGKTRIMAMVKAFSYGSGSFEIANLLEYNKIDCLAVAYADEGIALRNSGIRLPIMVMNADEAALDSMIAHDLEPEIYSISILRSMCNLLIEKDIREYPIHIKIDTGMHRLGYMEEEIPELLRILDNNPHLRVQSVFSHLAGSASQEYDLFSKKQIRELNRIADQIQGSLGYTFIRHIANTSAISRLPEAELDMVRLGIGLYGIDPSSDHKSPLQTVTSLKTSISQIKELPAGEPVGYDLAGTMKHDGKIATVRIGYADGYSRQFGLGKGEMLVNGTRAKTIGKICMDMCMIDITGIDASEGDEVVIFNDVLRVEKLAETIGTIPYEILTGISDRVKRVYYYE